MGHEPTHMAPKETVLQRGVHILRLVRVHMMVSMMSRPPNGAALHGRSAQHAENELPDARGLEGTVRKIAMIEARDGEHAHQIQRNRYRQRGPAEAHPNNRQTGRMHR